MNNISSATGREAQTQNDNYLCQQAPPPGTPNAKNARKYNRQYAYDKVGNIQQLAHKTSSNSFARNFSYHSGKNTVKHIRGNQSPPLTYGTFVYDAAGNALKSGKSRHYKWDHANRLKSYYNQTGTSEPSVYAHYLYDAAGSRTKKLVRTQGGDFEVIVYINQGFEYHKKVSGSTTREKNTLHVMDGTSRIASKRIGPAYPGDIANSLWFVLENHLGSSTTRLDANSTIIDREEYYPFGDSSLRTFTKKRYRYVGKEKDSESGLYYYGARYYAGWTCRFISVDPLAHKFADIAPYNYAGNKPIKKIDFEGKQEEGRKESPQNSGKGKNKSGEKSEKEKNSDTDNLHPLPDDVQNKIDNALAEAKKSGDDIKITVHQTKEGYSVNIEESPKADTDKKDNSDLQLPNPELSSPSSSQGQTKNNPNKSPKSNKPNRQQMESIPSQPLEQITPDDNKSVSRLIQTLTEGYVEKTHRLFKKGGEQLAKAARFLGKVSKGLGVLGAFAAVYDSVNEISEKGWTWKTGTKAVLGVGLAVASIAFPILALPAFIYGVADYFGLVDKSLNALEKAAQKTGDFIQEVVYKTKKGFSDLEQGLRRGWRPVW